jgi:hypothetical protein
MPEGRFAREVLRSHAKPVGGRSSLPPRPEARMGAKNYSSLNLLPTPG